MNISFTSSKIYIHYTLLSTATVSLVPVTSAFTLLQVTLTLPVLLCHPFSYPHVCSLPTAMILLAGGMDEKNFTELCGSR